MQNLKSTRKARNDIQIVVDIPENILDTIQTEELRQPFYVIATEMGALQEYEGRPMAFKKRYTAECQIEETERLMRKNGFKHLCGTMYIKPMTLEKCGKSKYHFCWLDKTIGELHRDVGKKYIIEIEEVDRERGRKQYDEIADAPTVVESESEEK